jgi:hypothetical protein
MRVKGSSRVHSLGPLEKGRASRSKTDHGGNDGELFGRTSNDQSAAGVLFTTVSRDTIMTEKPATVVGETMDNQWRKLDMHTPCPQK